jgi:hypothetical protein
MGAVTRVREEFVQGISDDWVSEFSVAYFIFALYHGQE